jgi:1-acyl-sn-glycerol-3-phosphate acyltransferase
MNRSFHAVKISGNIEDRGLPVLMVCNHMSWWDGIWALHINQVLFGRKYFFMMLEEQLRKNWFLNYTGGYSIAKNSRGILESIGYTVELLQSSKNAVLLFPQGEIRSMHNRNFVFEKGIVRILRQTGNEVQVVFIANIIDYHSNVKPTVYSFVHDYRGDYSLQELQDGYNNFYRECMEKQIEFKG